MNSRKKLPMQLWAGFSLASGLTGENPGLLQVHGSSRHGNSNESSLIFVTETKNVVSHYILILTNSY